MVLSVAYAPLAASAARGRNRTIEYEAQTRPQRRWQEMRGRQLRADGTRASGTILWRAANQVGKSRGLARKLVAFIRRMGIYADRRPGKVKILVASFSKEQMEPLHEKIWELLPKDEISSKVEYEPGYGFRGKPPRVTFTSGPGKGSVITFATFKQGSRRVAGGTYDIVVLDEPVEERVFGEVQPRVLHGNPGEIWITFTPTPDSPPLDYLEEKVKKGEIVELQTSLTLENVTLINEDGSPGRPLLTQEKIDEFAGSLLEMEQDMRLHGGWHILVKDRVLKNWSPNACVGPLRVPKGIKLAVGIDHGAGAGKQAAALVAIDQPQDLAPKVWLLEEYVADGYTTPEQDAEAILGMLRRRGWGFDAVDYWIGDRASGMNRYDIRKSNRDLQRQFARLLKRDITEIPKIEVPYKFHGSISHGFRVMNAVMGRRSEEVSHFRVDPKCVAFQNAATKWRGNVKDPLKDILDAVRYPVERIVRPDGWFAFKASYA